MNFIYGVLGKKLSHSFSRNYFEKKFEDLDLNDHQYQNFEFENLKDFFEMLKENTKIKGFNITNPYKEEIIPYLDEITEETKAIGAVNCVKIENGRKKGYNTDVYGFAQSIKPFLEPVHERALILGTGGAAKAVAHALKGVGVDVYFVTSQAEKKKDKIFLYSELGEQHMHSFKLIVNATPLGMYPEMERYPELPYDFIGKEHLCYDLIYNPDATLFLKKCEAGGATIMNGLSMLHLQAEKAWEIWKG